LTIEWCKTRKILDLEAFFRGRSERSSVRGRKEKQQKILDLYLDIYLDIFSRKGSIYPNLENMYSMKWKKYTGYLDTEWRIDDKKN